LLAPVIVVSPPSEQSPVKATNRNPESGSVCRFTGTPSGRLTVQASPPLPHSTPPAAMMVPPSGLVNVSGQNRPVTTGPAGSNVAPQVLGCDSTTRPFSGQSPVYPLNTC